MIWNKYLKIYVIKSNEVFSLNMINRNFINVISSFRTHLFITVSSYEDENKK